MSQAIQTRRGRRNRRPKGAAQPKTGPLSIVRRPSSDGVPAFLAIWRGDGDPMSPLHSRLADWPLHEEFAPLIEAARAAGNHSAAEQLVSDREYCGAMREILLGNLQSRHRGSPQR